MSRQRRTKEAPRGASKRGEAQGLLERLLGFSPAAPPEEELIAFRALGPAAEGLLLERTGRAGREERRKLLEVARLVGGKRLREGLRRMAEEGQLSLGELRALAESGRPFVALPARREELEAAEGIARDLESSPLPEGTVQGFLALSRSLQNALVRELCPVAPPEGAAAAKLLALASALSERRAPPPPALVELLSRWETQEAAEMLAAFLRAAPEGEGQRAIRKALYHLQTRGVPPPRREEKPPPPAPPAVEFARAYASTVDGKGQQLLWLARGRPGGGRYLFQALVREGAGIEEFYSREVSAREARELLGRLKPEGPYPIVEVPPAYACWLLARAGEENGRSGTPLPASYTSARRPLEPLEDAEAYPPSPHPIRRLLPDAGVLDLGEDWSRFLARAELASWLLPRERVEGHARMLAEAAGSRLVLTEEQRAARMREVVREASRELFADAELRSRLRARLEGMAYLYHRMGADPEARAALRAASGFAPESVDRPRLLLPPPFFDLLAHRSLLACLQPEEKEVGEEKPPGEAAPAGRIIVP